MRRNAQFTIAKELVSLKWGLYFPIIHSMIKTGMLNIKKPNRMMQMIIKRIIFESTYLCRIDLFYYSEGFRKKQLKYRDKGIF